jgi:hypothetical protein
MRSVTYDWRPKRSALGTHNNQLPRASGRTNRSSLVLPYRKGKLDVSLVFPGICVGRTARRTVCLLSAKVGLEHRFQREA